MPHEPLSGDVALVLHPLACAVPPHVRLRRVLKSLLRAYRYRLIALEDVYPARPPVFCIGLWSREAPPP